MCLNMQKLKVNYEHGKLKVKHIQIAEIAKRNMKITQ